MAFLFSSQGREIQWKSDLLATYANKFVGHFCFQCAANKTSKALQDALSKEEKAKIWHLEMETKFALTEEYVRDIVKAEVQCLNSQNGTQNSCGCLSCKDNETPNNINKPRRNSRSSSKGQKKKTPAKLKHRKKKKNNSHMVIRPTVTGGFHCQKMATAKEQATERRLQIRIQKMAVFHG